MNFHWPGGHSVDYSQLGLVLGFLGPGNRTGSPQDESRTHSYPPPPHTHTHTSTHTPGRNACQQNTSKKPVHGTYYLIHRTEQYCYTEHRQLQAVTARHCAYGLLFWRLGALPRNRTSASTNTDHPVCAVKILGVVELEVTWFINPLRSVTTDRPKKLGRIIYINRRSTDLKVGLWLNTNCKFHKLILDMNKPTAATYSGAFTALPALSALRQFSYSW